jgi:hypothetical protein
LFFSKMMVLIQWSHTHTLLFDLTNIHSILSLSSSIVYFFQKANVLPLSGKISGKVAVIGPLANASTPLLGNYNGQPETIVTIYEGIKWVNYIFSLSVCFFAFLVFFYVKLLLLLVVVVVVLDVVNVMNMLFRARIPNAHVEYCGGCRDVFCNEPYGNKIQIHCWKILKRSQ